MMGTLFFSTGGKGIREVCGWSRMDPSLTPETARLGFGPIRAVSGCQRSGREDLNLRPHGPEPCALASLRYAPIAALMAPAIIPQKPHLVKCGAASCQGHLTPQGHSLHDVDPCPARLPGHAQPGDDSVWPAQLSFTPFRSRRDGVTVPDAGCRRHRKLPTLQQYAILGSTVTHVDSSCACAERNIPESEE